ncbi:MAG: response regulator transcription factor [Bdellovibrionaceae bacterium]|nr:response regulator transcription factor [Pseudobdellovibrionaceae bacterium]
MVIHKILLVDDDQMIVEDFKRTLVSEPMFELSWVSSGAEAVKTISKTPRRFSVIIMDYLMPKMDGAETTKELLKINPDLIIAMYSGDQTREAIKTSHSAGAVEFLDKGISQSRLIESLKSFCKKFEDTYQVLQSIKPLVSKTLDSNQKRWLKYPGKYFKSKVQDKTLIIS